ncbi:hypothetical protein KIN20_017579 [Parelaphostrongylus tenuis]|uniref:Uncharacterized protein n=1 Tax=Parelaphostrongylus tenuis TaxID=148309 RepID=A0AAD5QTW7_PARTN|nr:hypothetical protein KIN20_017579 [Parelaphostrongylus tenuis]
MAGKSLRDTANGRAARCCGAAIRAAHFWRTFSSRAGVVTGRALPSSAVFVHSGSPPLPDPSSLTLPSLLYVARHSPSTPLTLCERSWDLRWWTKPLGFCLARHRGWVQPLHTGPRFLIYLITHWSHPRCTGLLGASITASQGSPPSPAPQPPHPTHPSHSVYLIQHYRSHGFISLFWSYSYYVIVVHVCIYFRLSLTVSILSVIKLSSFQVSCNSLYWQID